MDNFNKIICWHPAYYAAKVGDQGIVLTGEAESILLHGRMYHELFLGVDGSKSILEIISQSDDFMRQAALLNAIDDLIQKKILLVNGVSEKMPVYHRPDFSASPARLSVGSLELQIFSGFEDPDLFVQWAKNLNRSIPLGLVIVDDYLDPRIGSINRAYMQKKRPWLLVKPTGSQPMIGPCFSPWKKAAPCWCCLARMLIHNQPVRQWLQNLTGCETIQIPVAYKKETIKKTVSAFSTQALKFIDRQTGHILKSFDPDTSSFAGHPVIVRPQCPQCGNPGISGQRINRPVKLSPSPKIFTMDGGVRSVTPLQTVENIRQWVSPLTGIIKDLSELPGQEKEGITIFKASFSKTPAMSQTPGNNDFLQISLGKGVSMEQSRASALCEAIERYAAQYRGDEPRISACAGDLQFPSILPGELAQFSRKQYKGFNEPRNPQGRVDYEKYHPDIRLHWTPAWSLTEQAPCYIPFTYCYANTPFDDQVFNRFNTNGCAAGNTLEEAVLQGFLELVERDATAVWWYNRIPRPRVCIGKLPEKNRRRLENTLAGEWKYWVLDITHDFGIPVMAAVGRHRQTRKFRLGFGCHLNPVLACQRALTELCQIIAVKNRGSAVFDFDEIGEEPFLISEKDLPKKALSDFIVAEHADIRDDIFLCLEKAKQLGFETLVKDYARPEIGIHAVKVIVPGLCHIWPQLGNARLYKVPVALKWRKTELSEEGLNPLPLLI